MYFESYWQPRSDSFWNTVKDYEVFFVTVAFLQQEKFDAFQSRQTHLSSLKGSALTCGVSTDLLNTAPSAPEIRERIVKHREATNGTSSDQWT